jgi:hypothetical protein
MRWHLTVFLALTACSQIPANGRADDEETKRLITISIPKRDYLVGEAVLLHITFKNLTERDTRVPESWSEGCEPPIRIHISRDGLRFERFQFGYKDEATSGPGLQRTLKPGDCWAYQLRLLYSRMPPGRLAFNKPGKYFIRTGDEPTAGSNWHAQSNVLALRIQEPKGVDAKVWGRMQEEKMYSLLQTGMCSDDNIVAFMAARATEPLPADKHTVAQAVALLREFPESGYRDALTWALRNAYFREGSEVPAKLREDIRVTLGFVVPNDPGLKNDAYGFRKEMLVAEVLPLLSEYGKIPLDATPELKQQRVQFLRPEQNVGGVMQSLSTQFRAGWWPHGEGYLLSTERPAAPK